MNGTFFRGAAAILCAAATCAAAAPDPARLAESRAIMAATHMESQIDGMTAAMSGAFAKSFAPSGSGPSSRIAQVTMTEAMAAMKDEAMRPGGLMDMVAELYAERFSLEDLRQIRAFYESPVGQRFLAATPEMMQQVMQESLVMSQKAAPRLCERVKAKLAAEGIPEGATMKCPGLP